MSDTLHDTIARTRADQNYRDNDGVLSIRAAHILAIEDSALAPTLLGSSAAGLVTNLSTVTNLTLRASSFVFQGLLEAARLGTHTSLSITRRALVAAVSAAHLHHENAADLTKVPLQDEGYVRAVEKWTEDFSGYINNTISLVELFVASGFSLTSCVVGNAFNAAEESVRLVDSIFGSNDTSRAIASIILMTQREFSHENHLPIAQAGTLASISAVTKAITAFACLQAVTHNRSMKRIKDRVLCDAVVGAEQSLGLGVSGKQAQASKQLLVETERPLPRSTFGKSANSSRRQSTMITEETSETIEERRAVVEATPWPSSSTATKASTSLDSLQQALAQAEDLPAHIKDHNANLHQAGDAQCYHLTLKSMTSRVNRNRKRSHSTQHVGSDNDSITSVETIEPTVLDSGSTDRPLSKAYRRVKSVFGGNRSRKRVKSGEAESSAADNMSESIPAHQYEEVASVGLDRAGEVDDRPAGEEKEYQHATFPEGHYAHNLRKYMRYSSAAYGHLFMNLMGINREYKHEALSSQHANNHAFCLHAGIELQDILLSSFTDDSFTFGDNDRHRIISYVSLDHAAKAVVLTCRGSWGVADILTDLCADFQLVALPDQPEGYFFAHSGILRAAKHMASIRNRVHQVISEALSKYPSYGLILTGHSLGGGVCSLLGLLLSTPISTYDKDNEPGTSKHHTSAFVTGRSSGLPAGRPVHVYAFGPAASVSSDLASYSIGLVTSLVHDKDLVPCLSLGTLRDLKAMAVTLYDEKNLAEDIIAKVIGLQRRKSLIGISANSVPVPTDSQTQLVKPHDVSSTVQRGHEADLENYYWSLISTMRAASSSDKLYPAGKVMNIELKEASRTIEVEGRMVVQQARRVILKSVEDVELTYQEPLFAKSMMMDHSPKGYELALNSLVQAVLI